MRRKLRLPSRLRAPCGPSEKAALFAAASLVGVAAAAAEKARVSGHCVIRGQTLELRFGDLVQGRALACVLLSPDDVSGSLRECSDWKCAVDVVRAGDVLEPESHGNFRIRAAHLEISGEGQASYRGWLAVQAAFDPPLYRDFSARKEGK